MGVLHLLTKKNPTKVFLNVGQLSQVREIPAKGPPTPPTAGNPARRRGQARRARTHRSSDSFSQGQSGRLWGLPLTRKPSFYKGLGP